MTVVPSTDRGRSSRAKIVASAADLFYRQGVGATGMSQVVAASRTGKGQLYHYFGSKTDLILAVVDAQIEQTITPQMALLENLAGLDDLRAWADGAVLAHEQGRPARCPLGALVSETADQDAAVRRALDEGFDRWRALLAGGLRRLQEQEVIPSDRDAEDLAEVLLCAYEGGVLMSEARGNTRPLRLALDAALTSIVVADRWASERTPT